jgi:hypothetical protein
LSSWQQTIELGLSSTLNLEALIPLETLDLKIIPGKEIVLGEFMELVKCMAVMLVALLIEMLEG